MFMVIVVLSIGDVMDIIYSSACIMDIRSIIVIIPIKVKIV